MVDPRKLQDEIKQMWEEGGGRALGAEAFRTPLRDIPAKPPLTLPREAPVRAAIERMNANRQGCVLVVEGEKLAGIFTERDLLTRVLAAGLDPAATPLGTVMTGAVETLTELQTLRHAVHFMVSGGLRHVPIVDGMGRPRAVVSARDVLAFIAEFFPQEVGNLPPRPRDYMDRDGG